jgi:uncharacterized protein (TIGR02145 family)
MSFNQPQGEMSMKNTTKIAKLVFAAMLAIFCLACEDKEKALAEAIEATARAQAEAEAAEAAEKSVQEITDTRDGQKYRTVEIGGKMWMAENLNYQTDNSWCYENNADNCKKYGRLYAWSAAMTACPSGWHLPIIEEWVDLRNAIGGKATAGNLLKAKFGWTNYEGKPCNGTNEYGFSALPGGWRIPEDNLRPAGEYRVAGSNGKWWSASEQGGDVIAALEIMDTYNEAYQFSFGKFYGLSVRCVNGVAPPATPPPPPPIVVTLNLTGSFGFAAGQKIIVQNKYAQNQDKGFDIAIGDGGIVTEIKFSGMQEETENGNGRDTEYNFNNLGGSIFEKTKGELISDNTYFLTKKPFEQSIIPLIPIQENESVDASTVKRIEKQKNRKIASSDLLAKTAAGAKICVFVFERKNDDMLASLVYIDGDKTIYRDYPAEYNEVSTWRVDDNGDFGGLHPLFLTRTDKGLIMGTTWAAFESEGAHIYVEKDGKFVDTQFGGSRYWSPE